MYTTIKNLLPAVFIFCSILFSSASKPRNMSISREHVGVWFESPLKLESKYGKENLESMLQLVSGPFGTIVAHYVDGNSPESWNKSGIYLPELVAEHNLRNGTDKIKLIISFDGQPSDYTFYSGEVSNAFLLNNIKGARDFADKANAVYPGTVDTLLLLEPFYLPAKTKFSDYDDQLAHFLLYNEQFWLSTNSAAEFIKDSSRNRTQAAYKLGVTIPYMTCINEITQSSNFSEILKTVDVIVESIYYHKDVGLRASEEHGLITATLGDCEKKLKSVKKKIVTIPMVSCKPAVSSNAENMAEFLDCWQLMRDWAEENEKKVIMYEAFQRTDQFSVLHRGWWRLRNENTEWEDTSSFVAADDPKFEFSLKTGIPFQNNIAVYFDHRVRYYPHLTSYTKQELQQMLGLVSTQFSAIATGYKPFIKDSSSGENITWTAKVVAELNRENQLNPSFKPLRVIYTVYPEKLTMYSESPMDLAQPLQIANDANQIFPGTVSTILFPKADDIYRWERFQRALETQSGNLSRSFRFGIHVDLDQCEDFRTDLEHAGSWLSLVVVDISSQFLRPNYMDSALETLFAQWGKCEAGFFEEYPDVDVVLAIDCSKVAQTDENTAEAKCWKMVTDWAVDTGFGVIFYQAFDTPHPLKAPLWKQYIDDKTGGWWKLRQKWELNITADKFVEAFTASDSIEVNPSSVTGVRLNGTNCEDKEGQNVWKIICIVILAAVGFFATVVAMQLFRRNVFRRPQPNDHIGFKVLSDKTATL